MGVVLEDDHIVVRGLLYSRRIPIPSVTSVTYFPAVKWKSASGQHRAWSTRCSRRQMISDSGYRTTRATPAPREREVPLARFQENEPTFALAVVGAHVGQTALVGGWVVVSTGRVEQESQ